MNRPGFLDVSTIGVASSKFVPGEGSLTDGILIRDFRGDIVDTLQITADGHFRSFMGKVHREDVGEYVIRVAGHTSRTQLTS